MLVVIIIDFIGMVSIVESKNVLVNGFDIMLYDLVI